jgi:hypothetical protein
VGTYPIDKKDCQIQLTRKSQHWRILTIVSAEKTRKPTKWTPGKIENKDFMIRGIFQALKRIRRVTKDGLESANNE